MKEKKKMIKRQDLVNDILDVYDYIDVLEMENERLKNAVPKIRSAEKNVSFIDVLMIERGKKEIFNYSISSWQKVNCSYDEEANTYNFTSYDKLLEKKISCDRIPSSMSFEDFATYFKTELLELYKKEKEEALKEAKENE
jgi:hypothetical protein